MRPATFEQYWTALCRGKTAAEAVVEWDIPPGEGMDWIVGGAELTTVYELGLGEAPVEWAAAGYRERAASMLNAAAAAEASGED